MFAKTLIRYRGQGKWEVTDCVSVVHAALLVHPSSVDASLPIEEVVHIGLAKGSRQPWQGDIAQFGKQPSGISVYDDESEGYNMTRFLVRKVSGRNKSKVLRRAKQMDVLNYARD